MISLDQCAESAGLTSDELVFAAPLSTRHRALLASYRHNLHRGAAAVREMIVADFFGFLDLGIPKKAADALIVLRSYLSECPEARDILCGDRSCFGRESACVRNLWGSEQTKEADWLASVFGRRLLKSI